MPLPPLGCRKQKGRKRNQDLWAGITGVKLNKVGQLEGSGAIKEMPAKIR